MKQGEALQLHSMITRAKYIHRFQKRKYTGEAYEVHLAEVASHAMQFYYLVSHKVDLCVFIAVCRWHDTMEDQGITEEQLREMCDFTTEKQIQDFIYGVHMLSDLESGNRAERNRKTIIRLANAEDWVQLIKCADLVSNTRSIFVHDPNFFVTYSQEKKELLENFTHLSIGSVVHWANRILQDMVDIRGMEGVCSTCNKGHMRENTKRVAYRDKHGLLKYLDDVHGYHCTHCGNFEADIHYEDKVNRITEKGGVLLK